MRKINLLVVVLTTSDIVRLERCLYSAECQIPVLESDITMISDIKIVVNTTDKEYEKSVVEKFGSRYDVKVTHCDGTPGTGKNSVFDFFRSQEKNYDYLFQVDGDDVLYPTAFHELARYFKDDWDVVSFQSMDWMTTNFIKEMSHISIIPDKVWLYSWLNNQVNLRSIPQFKYVTDEGFGSTGERIFTPGTSMVLSKKLLTEYAETRHTNEIKLFEDYYFYLQLFKLHLDKKIKMCHINNSYIYLYDRTNENSVSTINCYYGPKELNLLTGFCRDNDMAEKHPRDCLEFISNSRLDFADHRDRIFWVRHLLDKYPTDMKGLDLKKLKSENDKIEEEWKKRTE